MTELPRPRPRLPKPAASQPPTVAIALMIGFVLSVAFVALTAVIIPGVLLMVVAGFGLFLFFVVQYFLWAKWLYPIVVKMEADSAGEQTRFPDGMRSGESESES